MARRRDDYEFPSANRRRYPWPQWTDGSTWEVVQGVDFNCEVKSLIEYLYHKAGALKMKVMTQTIREEGKPTKILFRFTKIQCAKRKPLKRTKKD